MSVEIAPSATFGFAEAGGPARPWPRYWARLFDTYFETAIVAIIAAVIFPDFINDLGSGDNGNDLRTGFVLLPFAMILDAFFQSYLGNTVGKRLAGISLQNIDNSKLDLFKALSRNMRVYVQGLILGVPLFSLFGMSNAFSRLKKGEKTSWDDRLNTNVLQHHNTPARTWLTFLATSVLLGAFFALAQAEVRSS